MVRKLKEVELLDSSKKIKKIKTTVESEPEPVVVAVKEVQKTKNPPSDKQLAARERARVAREDKKHKDLEEVKKLAIEEALKQKAVDEKKAQKAEERRAKKEKIPQTPIIAAVVPELVDVPKPDKPTFAEPKVAVVDIPVVKPVVLDRKTGIFSERSTDFDRGKKKGTPFTLGSFVRRIM